MYVALTRAKRRLYLSFSQSRMLHGQTHYNIPSRFLQEIPDHLLKLLQPVQKPIMASQERFAGAGIQGVAAGIQAVPSSRDSTPAWRVGQNVIHAKFGAGVIVNCEGHGADARVEVRFGRTGTKWLLLEYAKLVPA